MLGLSALQAMGFAALGRDVQISDRASFHGVTRISLGDAVRIDDFCVLSAGAGGIEIGAHVHVAAYTSLIGAGRISVAAFANLSSRVSIYSSSDDYSGRTMTNPTVPDEFKDVAHAPVVIGRHVIIGCGAVVLPGVRLDDGVAIGALSLVNRDCEAFGVYAGVPVRRIRDRSRELLQVEQRFLNARSG